MRNPLETALPRVEVRHATEADLPAIWEMARAFWAITDYADPFDAPHTLGVLSGSLHQRLLLVAEIADRPEGFAAGIAMPLLASPAVTHVTELAYWINPAHRGRCSLALLRHFEAAAAATGAKYLNMIALEASRPEVAIRIYERRGYQKIETTYRKRLHAEEELPWE